MWSWLWSVICWCQNVLLLRVTPSCLHALLMWVEALLLTPSCICTLETELGCYFACVRLKSASCVRIPWFMVTSCSEIWLVIKPSLTRWHVVKVLFFFGYLFSDQNCYKNTLKRRRQCRYTYLHPVHQVKKFWSNNHESQLKQHDWLVENLFQTLM